LLATATARWDGWFLLHGLRAVSALRGGRCDVAAEQFLVLLDFGIERREHPPRERMPAYAGGTSVALTLPGTAKRSRHG